MIEGDGSWNKTACSLDWEIDTIWGHIPDSPELAHVKDLLNRDEALRHLMLKVHGRKLEEIEGLRKEVREKDLKLEREFNERIRIAK